MPNENGIEAKSRRQKPKENQDGEAKAQAEIKGTSRKGISRKQGHKPKKRKHAQRARVTKARGRTTKARVENKCKSRERSQKPRTKPKAENEGKCRRQGPATSRATKARDKPPRNTNEGTSRKRKGTANGGRRARAEMKTQTESAKKSQDAEACDEPKRRHDPRVKAPQAESKGTRAENQRHATSAGTNSNGKQRRREPRE